MPVEKLHTEDTRAWAWWRIEEDEQALASQVYPFEVVPDSITNSIKRLEFLAGRVLIKELLKVKGLMFEGLVKDDFGKPFLKNSHYHISLSHSYPYVAAIIDKEKSVGIDLEQPKSKLLRVASRVLNEGELKDAGTDITKHCIYWSAKETLIKIHGKKDLTLCNQLIIEPFQLHSNGNLIGRIVDDDYKATLPLQYIVNENFVVVFNK